MPMRYKNPARAQILRKLREFKRIGRQQFIYKYSSGFGARSWYILYEDDLYDMKSVWAAAHDPPRWSGGFNTSGPHMHVPFAGFTIVGAKQAKVFVEGHLFSETSRRSCRLQEKSARAADTDTNICAQLKS